MLTAEKSKTKEGRTAQEEDTSTMQQTSKMVLKNCDTQGDSEESGIAASSVTSRPGVLPFSKGYRWAFVQGWCWEESRLGGLRLGGPRLGHGEGWQVTAWAGFLRSWGAEEGRSAGNQTGGYLHCAAGGPGEGGGCIGQGQWEEVCGGRADALTVQQNPALLAEDWSFADMRHHWRALRSSLFSLTIPVHTVSFPFKLSNSAQNKGHVGRAAYSLSSLELRENPQDEEEQHHCMGPSKPGWTQPSGTLHHIILLIANLCLWGNSRLLEDALHGLLKWGAESCSKGANVHQGASLRQRCGFLPKPDFKERSPELFSHYYRWSIVRMAHNESTRLLYVRIS